MRRSLARRAGILLALAFLARPLRAQERALVQGLLDVEGWSTDSASALLARNAGRPAGLARLCVWSAVEPVDGFVLYVQGEVEGGSAAEERIEASLEQAGIRYTRSRALVVDAGIISPIVGMFASRHLSTRNPLVGEPDGYSVVYPAGLRVSGKTDVADYRIGVVSLPVSNDRYMPHPSPRPRVAAGGGITPYTGVRIGVSGTVGPYMSKDIEPGALAGRRWSSYEQRVAATDIELSAGYVELRGELAHSWHEVPGHPRMLHGSTWYGEGTYAVTPRLFSALRVESNAYPYLKPVGTRWPASTVKVADAELGLGLRLGAASTLKLSYRRDRWQAAPTARLPFPDGHALAIQLSSGFDVLDAIERARTR